MFDHNLDSMLRHKRNLRVQPSDISGPLPSPINTYDLFAPNKLEAGKQASHTGKKDATHTGKKIPTSNLAQMIEQRTWENEQLRKELVYQQRKHGISMYLLEEVKLVVESLQRALTNFEQCQVGIEDDSEGTRSVHENVAQ